MDRERDLMLEKNAKRLETGLRTLSAGIPYRLRLLGFQLWGFYCRLDVKNSNHAMWSGRVCNQDVFRESFGDSVTLWLTV